MKDKFYCYGTAVLFMTLEVALAMAAFAR